MQSVPSATTPPPSLNYIDPRLTRLSAVTYQELQRLVTELLETTVGLFVGETDEDYFATVSGLFIGHVYRLHHQNDSKG